MKATINNYNTESKSKVIAMMVNWNLISATQGCIFWQVEPEKVADARAWAKKHKDWFQHADVFGTEARWFWIEVKALQPQAQKEKVVLPQIKQGRSTAKTVINKVYATEGKVLVLARDEDQRKAIIALNKEMPEGTFKFITFVKEEVK